MVVCFPFENYLKDKDGTIGKGRRTIRSLCAREKLKTSDTSYCPRENKKLTPEQEELLKLTQRKKKILEKKRIGWIWENIWMERKLLL